MKLAAGFFASWFFVSATGLACTTFQVTASDDKVYGKSYDWHADHGFAVVNKRGVRKTAASWRTDVTPATWVSRFGSVTFNQHGQEMPLGGMNERGLVVDIMVLGESSYPQTSEKPVLNELQWIQYILDTSETIEEAVAQASRVEIDQWRIGVHYLVCDRFGGCGAFEYLGRQLVVSGGGETVAPTLTNSTYRDSTEFLARHRGFGGNQSIPSGMGSLDRFVRASHLASIYDSARDGDAESYAFGILDSVKNGMSVWQIVYNPGHESITMKHRAKSVTHHMEMSALDFSCASSAQFWDLDGAVSGQVDHNFRNLNDSMNYALVSAGNRSLGGTFTETQVRMLAAYPRTTSCVAP